MVAELQTLSAPELRRLVAEGVTTAVVPFGSIENQGGHLPLGADSLLADAVGRRVAQRLDAVLAPVVPVGHADAHVEDFGTLSIGADELADTAYAIGRGLSAHGFELIVLASTHGGNREPLLAAVARLAQAGVTGCAPTGDVGSRPGRHSGHWLTSAMLALHPDLVELDRAEPVLADELGLASAQRGRTNLERYVGSIVAQVLACDGGLGGR